MKMVTNFKKLIYYFSQKPKNLFLIDALGALATTLLLLFFIRPFNYYFGLNVCALKALTYFAIFICCCSFTGWLAGIKKPKVLLMSIATINLLYCITTTVVLFLSPDITSLGIAYFIFEMVIILSIAYIELKTATSLAPKKLKVIRPKN